MHAFDLAIPDSICAARTALGDEEARLIAGGQTLIPTMKARLATPERLVSLRAITQLRGITRDGDTLIIGAMTPHAVVAREARADFPALADLAANIGDPMVRNRGTIGGSLANNDPSACYPSAVLGCGATIVTDRQEIAADDYFQGMFTTALADDEIITAVRFPMPLGARYEKFRQPASRFALTGVFVARFAKCVRVAVTGAGADGVFRWDAAEAALARDPTVAAITALSPPDLPMIEDLHGTAQYRAHLVRVLTARAVAKIGL